MLNLTVDQLKNAIMREKGLAIKYTLSRSPALAKFYSKRALEFETQLGTGHSLKTA